MERRKTSEYFSFRYYYLVALGVVILAAVMSWIGYGQDIEFHAERVAALAAEMKNGPGIYRIYTTVCEGYGYASPMFYGDIFLYPAAAMVALGMPLAIAFRLFLASIMLLSFLSMFCCAKAAWGVEQACFTAYIYAFSPILFADIFIRYAVGEALAFIFIPIVLLGFYRIVIEPKNAKWDWILLGLGMSGLILSHIISTVLTVILLVLLCLIFIKKIWNRKISIVYLLLAALLTVAITAYFTMPMLEQMATSQFFVMNRQESDLAGNTAPAIGLLFGSEYFNLLNAVIERVAGAEHRLSFNWFPGAYGYVLFFVVWARASKKNEVKSRPLDLYIGMALFYLILSVVPLVQPLVEPVVGFMKLPWRNLTFYMLFLSFAAGTILVKLWENGRKRIVRTGMLLATAGTLISFAGLVMITWHNGLFPYNELSTASVGLGEYLPSNVPAYDYSTTRGEVVWCSDEAVSYEFCRGNGYSELTFSETGEDTLFEVPVYMYRGYAVVDEETGENYEPYVSENGLVEFLIPQGHEGSVKIYYEGTVVQRFSSGLSLVTILVLCAALLVNPSLRQQRRQSRGSNFPPGKHPSRHIRQR